MRTFRAGDFASYTCGPPDAPGEAPAATLQDGNVAQHTDLAHCGHQGYPGYSPINARLGARNRGSHALRADVRHDVTASWNLETAVRWEQYQEAGDSVTGMVVSRLKLAPAAVLRATASTGFRAPSLPELGFNTIVFKGTADDRFDLHLGLNYFGKASPQWILQDPDCSGEISPAWVTNASAGWRLGSVRLSVVIDNALDEFSDTVSASCSELLNIVLGWGIRYSGDAAYGLSGRIFWTRVDARF